MSRFSIVRALLAGSCLFLLGSLGVQPLAAQGEVPPLTRTQFGLGYVGNAPDAMAGGAAYVLFPNYGGIGVYVDAKFDISGPFEELGFEDDLTADYVQNNVEEASFNKEESSWWSVNVAVMRPLTPSFIVYVGGGISTRTRYWNFNVPNDNPQDVGVGGLVWVEHPPGEERGLNFMFGTFMRITSRVSTQFGWETEPGGLTIGLSLRMPAW